MLSEWEGREFEREASGAWRGCRRCCKPGSRHFALRGNTLTLCPRPGLKLTLPTLHTLSSHCPHTQGEELDRCPWFQETLSHLALDLRCHFHFPQFTRCPHTVHTHRARSWTTVQGLSKQSHPWSGNALTLPTLFPHCSHTVHTRRARSWTTMTPRLPGTRRVYRFWKLLLSRASRRRAWCTAPARAGRQGCCSSRSRL